MFSGQNGKCWSPFTGLGYTFEVDGGRFAVGKEEAEAEGHTEMDSTPVVVFKSCCWRGHEEPVALET